MADFANINMHLFSRFPINGSKDKKLPFIFRHMYWFYWPGIPCGFNFDSIFPSFNEPRAHGNEITNEFFHEITLNWWITDVTWYLEVIHRNTFGNLICHSIQDFTWFEIVCGNLFPDLTMIYSYVECVMHIMESTKIFSWTKLTTQ